MEKKLEKPIMRIFTLTFEKVWIPLSYTSEKFQFQILDMLFFCIIFMAYMCENASDNDNYESCEE